MVYQILNSHEKRLASASSCWPTSEKKGDRRRLFRRSVLSLGADGWRHISRVSFFMKKFRKLGFIDYNGELKINNSLLNVVLHDQFVTMATDPFPVTQSPHRTPGRRAKLKDA